MSEHDGGTGKAGGANDQPGDGFSDDLDLREDKTPDTGENEPAATHPNSNSCEATCGPPPVTEGCKP